MAQKISLALSNHHFWCNCCCFSQLLYVDFCTLKGVLAVLCNNMKLQPHQKRLVRKDAKTINPNNQISAHMDI